MKQISEQLTQISIGNESSSSKLIIAQDDQFEPSVKEQSLVSSLNSTRIFCTVCFADCVFMLTSQVDDKNVLFSFPKKLAQNRF